MFSNHIDCIIGLDIMGYKPIIPTLAGLPHKNKANSQRVLWLNENDERFFFNPSSSAEHSRKLVKKMISEGYEFRMYSDNSRWICTFSKNDIHHGISKNDNEAICLAALKAHVNDS